MEPGRVLMKKLPSIEMQLAAKEFTYRALHTPEIRTIG